MIKNMFFVVEEWFMIEFFLEDFYEVAGFFFYFLKNMKICLMCII